MKPPYYLSFVSDKQKYNIVKNAHHFVVKRKMKQYFRKLYFHLVIVYFSRKKQPKPK